MVHRWYGSNTGSNVHRPCVWVIGPIFIDEKSGLKNGFEMKKRAIFVLNAAIKFSGVLSNVISVKRSWIWTSIFGQNKSYSSYSRIKGPLKVGRLLNAVL